MNPQTQDQDNEQQVTPAYVPQQSTPEADAAALREIDALEAETEVESTPEVISTPQPQQPISTPISPNPESSQTVVTNDPVVAPSVEAPVDPQATNPFAAPQPASSKKSPLIIVAIVAIVIVGVAAGFIAWQAISG